MNSLGTHCTDVKMCYIRKFKEKLKTKSLIMHESCENVTYISRKSFLRYINMSNMYIILSEYNLCIHVCP